MAKIKIAVKGNRAALVGNVDVIAGTTGQVCAFYFDEDWRVLPYKKITYKVGQTILGTYDIVNAEEVIPSSVLSTAGLPLEIGITGYSANKSVIIPTSWCLIGIIKPGAVIMPPRPSDTTDHIIYDGGMVVSQPADGNKHIVYDGGVIY